MSGFSADWLALREPADAAARSAALVAALRSREAAAPLPVVDLGAGTGANLRYLAPRLGGSQRWLLVDDDAALLAAARAGIADWAAGIGATVATSDGEMQVSASGFRCKIRAQVCDLARGLRALDLPGRCLVTASALLDLVSAEWLETLADACRSARAAVLFALTYNGRIAFEPGDPGDAFALACFNRHQRGEKSFGLALGPDAWRATGEIFAARGYAVEDAASDWRLDSRQRVLQTQLLDGWLAAAAEIAPDQRARLERWHARHRRHIDTGSAVLVVGHRDLAGRLVAR